MTPNINFLVVDDEIDIVNSFKSNLEKIGIKHKDQVTIRSATNASTALKILRQEKIDAIFLDLLLEGGMSGDDLLERLPDHLNHLYIVLISSQPDDVLNEVISKQHSQLDADYFPFRYLSKPVNFSSIESEYCNIVKFLNRLPLPYPLAYGLRKIHNSETSQGKLTAIINFSETLVKYLIIILLAEANQQDLTDFSIFDFTSCLNLLDNFLKNQNSGTSIVFIPKSEIDNILFAQLSNHEKLLDFLYKLKNISKELAHVHPESYYKSIFQQIDSSFGRLKETLALFIRYPLLAIQESRIDEKDSNYIIYKSYLLMGLDTSPNLKNIRTKLKLYQEKVYIANGLDDFLCLDPFLKFFLCTDCKENKLFMLSEIQNQDNSMIYRGFCNHEYKEIYDSQQVQKMIESSKTITAKEKRNPKMSTFEFDVFICHSSKDKQFIIDNIIKIFKKHKIKYWFDTEQISFGDPITQKIEEGLRKSKYVMPCLSENLLRSNWTRAEYSAILNAEFQGHSERVTVPIKLDNCNKNNIPMLLQDKKRVDISNQTEFEEFIDFLKAH